MNGEKRWFGLGRPRSLVKTGVDPVESSEGKSKPRVAQATVLSADQTRPARSDPAEGAPGTLWGLTAAATKGDKNPNQDAFSFSEAGQAQILAVADGVGSAVDSHLASRLAVDEFVISVAERLRRGEFISLSILTEVWLEVAQKLRTLYSDNKQLYPEGITALQTTLLTVVEEPGQYWLGVLGNGSVYMARGDFFRFPDHIWPWCITDLNITHQVLDLHGSGRLMGYLSGEGQIGLPRLYCIKKDDIDGEFFVLTTDGVSSLDQTKELRDNSGRIAHLVSPHVISLLMQYVKPVVVGKSAHSASNAALQQALELFLASSRFDDDATVGVLLSPRALTLYR
jgi:serine/threonine protein phosphatase PrpC